MELRISVQRVGGIWRGSIDGHPDVDERALAEEIAVEKTERAAKRIAARGGFTGIVKIVRVKKE